MTPKQEKVIGWLKEDILLQDGLGKKFVDEYEYKQFKVEEIGYGIVFLTTKVGRKTDEGTMAAVFCRRSRLIKIGPKGGVQSLIGRKVSGYHKVLIMGYES